MFKYKINFYLLAVLYLVLAGCYNKFHLKLTQMEIDSYIKEHSGIPEFDKACISEGQLKVGMRKETVLFLLGEPKDKSHIALPWVDHQDWTYTEGGKLKLCIEEGKLVLILFIKGRRSFELKQIPFIALTAI